MEKQPTQNHGNIFKTSTFFNLQQEFLKQYSKQEPDMTDLGYVVYKRTYARELGNGETEEWWQTVKRVVEGVYTIQKRHCQDKNLPWNEEKARQSAQKMYDLIFNFKFTPPGRGLWMMGTDYVFERATNAPLFNCAFRSTKNIDENFAAPFTFLMDMSMLGVGVGSDTDGEGKVTITKPDVDEDWTYTIPDSREGWVESVKILLNGYGDNETIPGEFDYSEIREKGEPLKGFGGTASGPQPLKDLHNNIEKLMERRMGEEITSTDIVDLQNLVGKCVVAGGIRRTAEIMFGQPDDQDFLKLKDPEEQTDFWGEPENKHHRWASNNSIFAEIGMDYDDIAERTAKNGEPGFIWVDNAHKYGRVREDEANHTDTLIEGSNPCGEIMLEDGEKCNLVETYPVNHDSLDEWLETLKYAYLYSKTVTLLPNHNEKTNAKMMKNRRIGTSISGITQAFEKYGRRKVLDHMDEGYDMIQDWDETYSNWLAVPESIRTTTVKPSGTVSILADVTSGIHYPISKYYLKNMRLQDTSELLDDLEKAGYPIVDDPYSDDTKIVKFPQKSDHIKRGESEVSIWEQLENVAQVQKYWSDNSVSVTVKFTEDEAEDIPRALELYEDQLKTISFLPSKTDVYEQAPLVPITEEEYKKRTEDLDDLTLSGNTNEKMEKFCQGDKCEIDFTPEE